ncbi:hypothetical protein [uncultured Tenacibaculum sp.]|uniref:hypothetical protein n=1 Tax=uncultured Tenacibaculum sp. TaxID=174713 RepID=UPI00260789AE|nr:hypothetical protein [uncultured Tenacibaculum sp.]
MISKIKNLGLELEKSEQKQIKGGLGTPYRGPDYDHIPEGPFPEECIEDLCYTDSDMMMFHDCCRHLRNNTIT